MNPSATPALFDPQVNGYAGVDFQQDGLTPEQILTAVRAWRRDGGDRFFLTLITDAWPRLVARLRHLRALRDSHPELTQGIAGWHIEGPFLSDRPGFHGAHDPAVMRDPVAADFAELAGAVAGQPLLLTVAPERRGCLDAIREATRLGIRVSLGHTDAPSTVLREAVAAGATGFTHLGNGCPQQLDRHDNILWRVLEIEGLTIGLIADGIHVAPALFRLLHRLVPADRLYYTTDAMAAAGAPPGHFTIGRLEVEVGADGIVRQPGRTNFAGSALSAGDVAVRALRMLGPEQASTVSTILARASQWLKLP